MKKTQKHPANPALWVGKMPICLGLVVLAAPLMVQASDNVGTETASVSNANRHRFLISKQPLYSALNAIAEQGGVQFVYTDEMVKGLSSPGASGQFSTEEALRQVLAGSGLGYRMSSGNTITLAANAVATQPAEVKTYSDANGEPTTLPVMTVTGEADYATNNSDNDPYNPSYNRTKSSAATKTDTPLMKTPMSVQTVPQQVIKDQQVITIEDAVKNVSGVQRNWGYGNLYDNFLIRGFATSTAGVYRNGFRMQTYAAETANVESIDILKGPAAMLYGRSDAGGMVNIVTKKPLDQAYYALQQQFGSYDFYRTTMDATGPINKEKTLLYRVNLAYTNADSFRDFNPTDRFFLAPSLTWRPTDATEVNLNFEYKNNDFVLDQGIPSLIGANRPANVPINRVYHEPDSNSHVDDYIVDLNWSHRFNDSWKLRNGFIATIEDYALETVVAPLVRPGNQNVGRFANFADTERHSYGAYLDITGQFDTLGVQHEVLAGADWYEYSQSLNSSFRATTDLSIFNPVYGTVNFAQNRGFRDNAPNSFFKGDDEWFGIYFQDQITLWDKLHILGGGRYDWTRAKAGSSSVSPGSINQAINDTDRFQPRVGVVYQAQDWLSLYGNYVESMGINNGVSATGQGFTPEIAEQFEAGIKTDFLNGRLNATLAYFNIEKQNMLTADPNSFTTPVARVAIGKARSEGLELDIKGQITDSLSVIGTYALTDTRIVKNNDGLVGNRLPNVPENSGSLWAKYDFNGTSLDGFSLGSGIYVVGQRQGDNQNTLQLPGYARWDAMAAYRFKIGKTRLTTQLNVNNILDKQYYKNTDVIDGNPRGRISVGEPLTLMGSIKLEF